MLKVANSVINASQIATPISFAGDVTLSTGNLVIGTSGKGIDFSITSHPAGMTSELLADYEEGTFTPVFSSTGATFAYVAQVGRYTKVGNLVFINIFIQGQGSGTLSNICRITGLPFIPSTALDSALVAGRVRYVDYPAGAVQLSARTRGVSTDDVTLEFNTDDSIELDFIASYLTNANSFVTISGSYRV